MLAFRGPQDAYRRSSDFFLSQIAAPESIHPQLSEWRSS
jgi:hypothetical protein